MEQADSRPGTTQVQWQTFLDGPLYAEGEEPWRDDPAFAMVSQFPGLRDAIGGRIAQALVQAVGLVKAIAQTDLIAAIQTQEQPQGLCLGFGMNALEPYDLLQVFSLAQVHAYEWIGEQVVEAAQTLAAFAKSDSTLPERIRLHHETLSNLQALPDRSIQVVYVGNVFTYEVPMAEATFTCGVKEVLRVLADGGVLLSRGSSGALETALSPAGIMLWQNPLVSVFQKRVASGAL